MELVKHKANADDVIKLQEGKTNKADTVSHMECLETMHRMLLHVNGLLIEQANVTIIIDNSATTTATTSVVSD